MMKWLLTIVGIIIYYIILSQFIIFSDVAAGLAATAYIFIPLIGIPLVVGSYVPISRSRLKQASLAGVTVFGCVTTGLLIVYFAKAIMTPSLSDPVVQEIGPAVQEERMQSDWIASGKFAVKQKLKDPDSAKFRNVVFHKGKDGVPVACGEVNSKNSFGGYSGFQYFISAGRPDITYLAEQMDPLEFVKLWDRLCVN